MLNVSIKITGDKEFISKLDKFRTSILDFKDAMTSIGKELGDGDRGYFPGQVFASQGGVIGMIWPTNLMATRKYKAKHYPQYATSTLIRTGAMKGSFKYEANKNSVTITNGAPQFPYHQSSAPRHKMPYRPMMSINSDVEDIVKKVLEADIKDKLEKL